MGMISTVNKGVKPMQYAKKWRDTIPVHFEGVDETFRASWHDLRNGLIAMGREARRTMLMIDSITLWDIPEIEGRNGKENCMPKLATKPRSSMSPEVRVMLEQAAQYNRFRTLADDAQIRLQIYQERLSDDTLDQDAQQRTLEVIETCTKSLLAIEAQASKQLTELQASAVKLKTLAVTTIRDSDSALNKVAKLAQDLILGKERLEVLREKEEARKDPANMTDAELREATGALVSSGMIPGLTPNPILDGGDDEDEDE